MGQTGRRSIATHILAVKIALGRLHFHGFGVARQGPWITWVNKLPVNAPNPSGWHHAHVADLLEKRELTRRRNLYVGRGEHGIGSAFRGGKGQGGSGCDGRDDGSRLRQP